jgi:hypothetical protein
MTEDLRALIRDSKALLLDWVKAANDAADRVPDPPVDPLDWKELAAAYHAHHFNCPTCIAAGRGSRYGQRCGRYGGRIPNDVPAPCNASIGTLT